MTILDSENQQVRGYLIALGKIVFSFGDLEHALLIAHYLFSDLEDPDVQQVRLTRMPLGSIIQEVRDFAVDRLSDMYKGELLAILDDAVALKDERNDNIHGAWAVMVDASSGNFAHVQRYRTTAKKGDKRPKWNTTTPSIDSLNDLSRRVIDCASRLGACADRAYHRDPEFQAWLEAEQSKLGEPFSN